MVELFTARINFNLVIVTVQILTFPLVAAQLVRAGEIAFNHYLKLPRHVLIILRLMCEVQTYVSGRRYEKSPGKAADSAGMFFHRLWCAVADRESPARHDQSYCESDAPDPVSKK